PVECGGLDALLALPDLAHMLAVAAGLQSSQAAIELGAPPGMEVRAVQINRGAGEGVEEGAWQRMEERLPAQQTEQAGDQAVLHIMHRRIGAATVLASRQLDRQQVGTR